MPIKSKLPPHNPAEATAIGVVIAEWAYVEYRLRDLANETLYPKTSEEAEAITNGKPASALLTLIRKGLKAETPPAACAKEIELIFKKIEPLLDLRHMLVHGITMNIIEIRAKGTPTISTVPVRYLPKRKRDRKSKRTGEKVGLEKIVAHAWKVQRAGRRLEKVWKKRWQARNTEVLEINPPR